MYNKLKSPKFQFIVQNNLHQFRENSELIYSKFNLTDINSRRAVNLVAYESVHK